MVLLLAIRAGDQCIFTKEDEFWAPIWGSDIAISCQKTVRTIEDPNDSKYGLNSGLGSKKKNFIVRYNLRG
jgi:hypothetical protein